MSSYVPYLLSSHPLGGLFVHIFCLVLLYFFSYFKFRVSIIDFDTQHLLNMSFANIFFQSVACLFILSNLSKSNIFTFNEVQFINMPLFIFKKSLPSLRLQRFFSCDFLQKSFSFSSYTQHCDPFQVNFSMKKNLDPYLTPYSCFSTIC